MMQNPNTMQRLKETIKKISILDSVDFPAIDVTLKTRIGAVAAHSPHIAAGDATLEKNWEIKIIA